MKTLVDLKSLLAGVLLGVVATFSIAAGLSPSRVEWEYKIVTANAMSGDLEHDINRSVKNDWEFISVSRLNDQWGMAVFKRPRR